MLSGIWFTDLYIPHKQIVCHMNLEFQRLGKKGEDDEYILFHANEDCNLRDYLVHDDTFNADGEISNKLRHMYRFNRTVIAKKGEYVALYVKQKGVYTKGTIGSSICHLFYWGLDVSVFNNAGDHLYLLRIAETSKSFV